MGDQVNKSLLIFATNLYHKDKKYTLFFWYDRLGNKNFGNFSLLNNKFDKKTKSRYFYKSSPYSEWHDLWVIFWIYAFDPMLWPQTNTSYMVFDKVLAPLKGPAGIWTQDLLFTRQALWPTKPQSHDTPKNCHYLKKQWKIVAIWKSENPLKRI